MVFRATLDGDCVQNSVIREDGLFYRSVTWCLGQHWMVTVYRIVLVLIGGDDLFYRSVTWCLGQHWMVIVYRTVCLGEMTCSIEV